jgi:hypothetical protein
MPQALMSPSGVTDSEEVSVDGVWDAAVAELVAAVGTTTLVVVASTAVVVPPDRFPEVVVSSMPLVSSALLISAHPIATTPSVTARATKRHSQHVDFGNGFMNPPIPDDPFYHGMMYVVAMTKPGVARFLRGVPQGRRYWDDGRICDELACPAEESCNAAGADT